MGACNWRIFVASRGVRQLILAGEVKCIRGFTTRIEFLRKNYLEIHGYQRTTEFSVNFYGFHGNFY